MHCMHCEIKDQFKAEMQLCKIRMNLDNDDSEFRLMFQQRSFKEFDEYLRMKYAAVRRNIQKTTVHAHCRENGITKSDQKSERLRKEGNNEFAKCEFLESLKYFYKAMAFAETDEKRALCYGNISAIFLKTEKIKCCLTAIDHAKELHPTNDNFFMKLSKRQEQCNAFLEDLEYLDYPEKLPLSHPANPKNSEVVECIERGSNGNVFAKQDMKMGDVIAVTKPFIIGGRPKRDYISCNNCWKEMSGSDIFVCGKCTFVIYCSEKCKAENIDFHEMICDRVYVHADLTNVEMMAMKLAYKVFSNGIDMGKEEFQKCNTTSFDWDQETIENQVKTVFSMKTGSDWKPFTNFIMLNSYSFVLEQLKKTSVFNELVSKFENGEELFFKTYWKAFEIISANSITSDTAFSLDLSIYFDLIMGFFNHSCAPNVFIFRDGKSDYAHYVLLNDVKSGDELCIAYE